MRGKPFFGWHDCTSKAKVYLWVAGKAMERNVKAGSKCIMSALLLQVICRVGALG